MKNLNKIIVISIFFILTLLPLKVMAEEKIILIDPGHGGFDGGAKSKSGTIEKDINLSISLKLKEDLKSKGYTVYLTREIDEALGMEGKTIKEKKRIDLNKRRSMKKEVKCDVFISIHQNMFPQSKCFGAQVWHGSNEVSKNLANNIQESLKEVVKDNNKRLSKPAGDSYLILRDDYEGASVLVECGFLSNPEEDEKLKSDEHQSLIVQGISLGIDKYFEAKN